MEEDELWNITTLNAWNVALNAKTEMNDFEQLNYGSKSLWEWWLLMPKTVEVALNANGRKWWLWTLKLEMRLWTPNWKHGFECQTEKDNSKCRN